MFKQTLLAIAIGTLIGFASPQAMAVPQPAPAPTQQEVLKEYYDVTFKAGIQAAEKEAQAARESGDEKRAAVIEKATNVMHEQAAIKAADPMAPLPPEAKPATPPTQAEIAIQAEIAGISTRAAAN